MNTKLFLQPLSVLTLLVFSIVPTAPASVINFDDMTSSSNGAYFAVITNGYQGFNWVNFNAVNALLDAKMFGTNGYYYGMVTASNIADNGFGTIAELDSSGTNFNFLSAFLTGAWNSNLNIEVQGFSGVTLLYDTTVVVGATAPTLFTFNYLDIDRLTFNSFGGQPAFGFNATQFAMDNLTFEFVPEPPLLLTTAGALLLCPLLKRKRA